MELIYKREGPDHLIMSDTGIIFRFSRVFESREDVVGMLRISLRGFAGYADGDIYGDSRIVLTGPRSKADVVRAATSRVSEPDWYALVERACQRVRQAIEEGEPPVNLGTIDLPKQSPWLIEPLFRDSEHAMIYGRGGAAKSLISLSLLACLTHGAAYLGFPIMQQYRTLYLDYEDSWETHAMRLDRLANGLAMGPRPEILHKEGTAPLGAMVGPLSKLVAQEAVEVGVVDSAGAACGSDPESADAALSYYRALKALGLRASITIAHHSKVDDAMPFGSVFWWNSMRNIWLAKVAHETAGEMHLGLFHKKSNNGEIQQPIGLHVSFHEDAISIEREDLRNIEDFTKHLSLRQRVIALIQEYVKTERRGPSRDEIAEQLQITKHSLRTILSRMRSDLYESGGYVWLVDKEHVAL